MKETITWKNSTEKPESHTPILIDLNLDVSYAEWNVTEGAYDADEGCWYWASGEDATYDDDEIKAWAEMPKGIKDQNIKD